MKEKHKTILLWCLIPPVLYFAISCMGFQARNPKANGMQIWAHFPAVITWKKLPQFQE